MHTRGPDWRQLVSTVLCLLAIASCGDARSDLRPDPLPATLPERALLDAVSIETIADGTAHLSGPDFQGRGTGQPGGERAAQWIAEQFRAAGLEPAGDSGSFLHAVAFRRTRFSDSSLIAIGADTLRAGKHFVMLEAPTAGSFEIRGDVLFIAYGIMDSALGRHDLEGVNVDGKIVVLLGGQPADADSAAFTQAARQQAELLARASALLIGDASSPEMPFEMLASRLTRDQVALADAPDRSGRQAVFAISDAALDRLLGGAYAAIKRRADAGENVTRVLAVDGSVRVTRNVTPVTAWNVVARLPGSDTVLREQAVVFSAHYDAFGVTATGDYYPGAIDNALGTSQLVALARAFARHPDRPRRSVLFMAVTGEEYGLLGTRAWLNAPTWPLSNLVAALNFDASDSEVHGPLAQAVGLGADQSPLGAVFSEAARDLGITEAPDPYPEQRMFTRSDHYAFVQRGIPGLMLIGAPAGSAWVEQSRAWLGPQGPYHERGDTVRTDWDMRGPHRSAQLMALIGWRVANAPAR